MLIRRARLTRVAAAIHALALLAAPGARAQAADSSTAEALFAAGRDALERGDYETACAKLSESQRLDPGAGTLMNLAACNEKRGRLASAWENWREALATLRPDDDRRPTVSARLEALEARLPRIVIHLSPDAPPNTSVKRDGQALGSAALGLPLPLDPGEHRITAVAPGFEEQSFTVRAEEGKTATLTVAPGPALPTPAPVAPPPVPPAGQKAHASSSTRTLALVLGGTGAAALVGGVVTGILAIDRKNDIEDRCTKAGDTYLCDQKGVDAAHSGKAFAVTSSVLVPVGLALGAVGLTLWLTSDNEAPRVAARVSGDSATLSAEGAF